MSERDKIDFVTIPRLEEYYRPNSPMKGWGEKGVREWRKPLSPGRRSKP